MKASEPGSAQATAFELGKNLLTLGGWSADAGQGVGSENGIVGGIGIFAHASQCQCAEPLQEVVGAPLTELFRVPSALRALWAQPLREHLLLDVAGIDWLIVGGEGGAHADKFELSKAWQLRRYCSYKNVPFFMAQLGSAPLIDGVAHSNNDGKNNIDWEHWPQGLRVRELPKQFSLV